MATNDDDRAAVVRAELTRLRVDMAAHRDALQRFLDGEHFGDPDHLAEFNALHQRADVLWRRYAELMQWARGPESPRPPHG